MQIIINTEALNELDKQILGLLNGGSDVASAPKAAPAAKKAPATKATPKAAEPVEEPEEAVEEPEEDLVGGDDAPTMDDAVALATKMVSNGKAAEVKAALASVGAKRVSEVADDKLATFIAELS